MMRTTLTIDEELAARIEELRRREGLSLNGVINSLLVTGRKIEATKFVFAGAGAGGIGSTKLLLDHGATNVTLVDSVGIISRSRSDLSSVKSAMLDTTNPQNTQGGLADALRGADVFIGLSAAGALSSEMVSSMAKDSIVFAMANPIPEIWPATVWTSPRVG